MVLNILKYCNVIKVSVKLILKFFFRIFNFKKLFILIFNVELMLCVCLVCDGKNLRNGIMYNVYF